MNSKLLATALSSLLFAATATASAAGAASTTNVGISNVAISVFDLTPTDGVAAGYTVRNALTSLSANLYRSGWDGEMNGSASDRPTSASTVELEYRSEYASAAWDGTLGGLSLSVRSTQSNFFVTANASQSMLVTLAPHTGFAFTGVAAQSGVTPAVEPWSYSLTSHFRAQIYDFGDIEHELVFERKLGGENAPDYTLTEPFSLTYVNDTDLPRELSLTINTYAYAHAPLAAVSAVPEPSTYLMLGAGLLGICLRTRRSRQA